VSRRAEKLTGWEEEQVAEGDGDVLTTLDGSNTAGTSWSSLCVTPFCSSSARPMIALDCVNLAVEVRGSEGFEASALVDGVKHAASVVGARGVRRVRHRVSSSNSSNIRLRRE
jgi:hypothetical protein